MTDATTNPNALPAVACKKATNLVRDARLAILVGLIPIWGLIYMLRLVQWDLLRRQFPALATITNGEHAALAGEFRGALHQLWFAVALWPGVVLFCVAYLVVT